MSGGTERSGGGVGAEDIVEGCQAIKSFENKWEDIKFQ